MVETYHRLEQYVSSWRSGLSEGCNPFLYGALYAGSFLGYLAHLQCLSASVGVPLLPGRLHFSVERLVRVSEPQLDPNVVTLPTRCHHHPRWNRAGPDFQQVVPRDTWYLVVVLENRWALYVQHPCALPAHLQNKSHGKSPFFIQLATISHLLVRHSLGILLILVASRLLCK